LFTEIEARLIALVAGIAPDPRSGPGRPPILPAAILWASLTLGVLRGAMSQLEIWRIVIAKDLWRGPRIAVSDEAVYRRFAKADDTAMALLFEQITALLLARHDPADHRGLAPFATAVVAIDETTLDPIARSLPSLRGVPLGSDQLPSPSPSSPIRIRTRRCLRAIWSPPCQRARSSWPISAISASSGSMI
jgi:hypothetical protein